MRTRTSTVTYSPRAAPGTDADVDVGCGDAVVRGDLGRHRPSDVGIDDRVRRPRPRPPRARRRSPRDGARPSSAAWRRERPQAASGPRWPRPTRPRRNRAHRVVGSRFSLHPGLERRRRHEGTSAGIHDGSDFLRRRATIVEPSRPTRAPGCRRPTGRAADRPTPRAARASQTRGIRSDRCRGPHALVQRISHRASCVQVDEQVREEDEEDQRQPDGRDVLHRRETAFGPVLAGRTSPDELAADPLDDVDTELLHERPDRDEREHAECRVAEQLGSRQAGLVVRDRVDFLGLP